MCGCKPTWLEIEPGGGGEGEKKDPRKNKELRKERETLDKNSAGFELTPAHPVWPILKPRDAMWRRQLDRLNQIREGKCGSSRKRHLTFSKGRSGKL